VHEGTASPTCGIVVDHIIGQVASKEYNVGDKLPPERDLAKQLCVSRATVREAIKVLNYMGFIDSNQGSGNYITDTYDRTTANIMKVMYLRGEVDFHGFTVFRQMLELQSFSLALVNATEKQISEMKQIVDLLDVTTDSGLIFSLDMRFHTLLAEASCNPLIVINFHALSSVIEKYMSDTYHKTVSQKAGGFERLQEYHHAIVDALKNKDRELGIEAIQNHFSWLY
jgi:GntR family transcriptional repressor for pyruvate dehydrogenase complex